MSPVTSIRIFVLVALAALTTACGGSGGGGNNNTTPSSNWDSLVWDQGNWS